MRVFGISTDDVVSQAAFHKAQKLDFTLLSDPDGGVARKYGVLMRRRLFAQRVTFVIDGKGVVRHVARKVDVLRHGKDLAAIIDKLRRS